MSELETDLHHLKTILAQARESVENGTPSAFSREEIHKLANTVQGLELTLHLSKKEQN